MSTFKYDNFMQWERFPEMAKGLNRICGAANEDSFLRATLADLPEHLVGEAGAYMLEFAIKRPSLKLLRFVTEFGVLDRPEMKNNLDVAVMIRDRVFTGGGKFSFEDNPFGDLLKKGAEHYGLAFVIDSMDAVYDDGIALKRSAATFFASGEEKLHSYTDNLKILMEFTPPQYLVSAQIGNIAIKNVAGQINNLDNRELLLKHLEVLGKLNFDDLSAISSVIKDDSLNRSAFLGRQIDAAVCKELPDMKLDFFHNLRYALEARPMNTLMTLISMPESQFSTFVSTGGMHQYLLGKWLHEGNAHIMADQNFLDLHDLFNQRLLSNPFFNHVFERTEYLHKPNVVSVTGAFVFPAIREKGLAVDMLKTANGSKKVASGVLKSFAQSLELIAQHCSLPQVIQAGLQMIESQLSPHLIKLYTLMSKDEVIGKKMKPFDTVDNDYKFKFAAIRLCAELHTANPATNRGLEKLRPIEHQLDAMDAGVNHKEALLMLVKTYDEATILDALKDYKPGIRPMIELGVLSEKHISLLPVKDRGELLENAMGM
jgi:hypothetical protein